jgi:hypothetical protein
MTEAKEKEGNGKWEMGNVKCEGREERRKEGQVGLFRRSSMSLEVLPLRRLQR